MLSSLATTPARADDGDRWTLTENSVRVRVHAWTAACGERPAASAHAPGARYLRRGLSLLPVDDAPPVFGPGICRALVPAVDARETLHDADAVCAAGDGSSARVALRQPDPATLTVVQQVRRTPGKGCVADVVSTWALVRDRASPPPTEKPRAGSQAALAPVPPPVVAPPPVAVPARTIVEASVRLLPPPDPPVAGSRIPLFALSALLVLIGLVGLVRGGRRSG